MLIEVVTFRLPDTMTYKQLLENYKDTTSKWRGVDDLIRKSYLYQKTEQLGGGVYHWKSAEAADKWHGEDWKKSVREVYGSDPIIQRFNVPVVADNEILKTTEFNLQSA